MDATLRRAVAERIARADADAEREAEPAAIASATPVSGGSINQAWRVELADGRRRFVKAHGDARLADGATMFEREAEGLAALAATGTLRVPADPLAGSTADGGFDFLVMEWLDAGSPDGDLFERFGRGFARLHRRGDPPEGAAGRFGFAHDNTLGSTPQPNDWSDDWVEFWRHRRLGHQLDLARRGGRSDATLDRLGDRLLDRLDQWLELPDEPSCLLHGDLWGGNYLVAAADEAGGEPALIDPACYYGHREADLAMTRLFGGFPPAFYAAYETEWPLPPGSEERLAIYELYHLLNHLNLFGRSYRRGCLAILERLVA